MTKTEVWQSLRERYGVAIESMTKECLSTGIPDLDRILNGGWLPGINVVEGPAGTGKSLVAAMTIDHETKNNMPAIVVETEPSFDTWASHLDLEDCIQLKNQANSFLKYGHDFKSTATRIKDLVENMELHGEKPGVIVIDSLDALQTRKEMAEATFGELHQNISVVEGFLSVLHNFARKHRIPIIITRQEHDYQRGVADKRSRMDGEDNTNFRPFDVQDQQIETALKSYSSTYIRLSQMYQFPGEDMPISPFIAAGRKMMLGRVSVDLKKPTCFILGVSLIKHVKKTANLDAMPITIPFSKLNSFRYNPPIEEIHEFRSWAATEKSVGDDAEPDERSWIPFDRSSNGSQDIWDETPADWHTSQQNGRWENIG